MDDELQQAILSGKLAPESADAIKALQPGAYCQHKSWGFGQVAEWRLITGQIIIDFTGKKGHPMQAQYAVDTLTVIPDTHINAKAFADASGVRALAEANPVELMRDVLRDFGGKATVDQLTNAMVPAIFDAAAFKKWWESTKKKLKSDGHFQVPSKKTDPIELHDTPASPREGLLAKFRSARHLKDQVVAIDQLLKSLDDFAQEVEELRALAVQIEDVAGKGRKLQAAQAVELLLARDEICARHDALQPGDGAPTVADILRGEERNLPELFAALPAGKQRKVLESFPDAFGDDWTRRILGLIQEGTARLAMDIQKLMSKEGREQELHLALKRAVAERAASSEVLYWLCKERGGPFPDMFNADLFGAVLSGLERDQLAETRRGARLHDLLLDDRELLGDLLKNAELDVVRDSMRRLMLTPVFEDLNKRSLMARIIKLHPEMQSMITGGEQEHDEALTVSWVSLERRKQEYDDLVNKLIPQNVKDIAIARSYGDLRENFEFKSAKEQQAVLARRKDELERMLGNARGTNFENPDTSTVSIGTVVQLSNPDNSEIEEYSILGAWDSAPDKGIISYKAAMGQALLGHAVGETIQLPTESGTRSVRIEKIDTFRDLDLLNTLNQ